MPEKSKTRKIKKTGSAPAESDVTSNAPETAAPPDSKSLNTVKGSGVKLNIALVRDCIESAIPEVIDDEIILKCRKTRNINDDEFDGYHAGPDEQILIQTGIKEITVDASENYGFSILPIPDFVRVHEVETYPEPFAYCDELCVVLYVHGKRINIVNGMVVGRLVLRKKINAKVNIQR